jgi:phosphinothricin acetyltransferase
MSGGDDLLIRASRDDDIPAIAAIYAHHVLHGLASFEEVPPPAEEIARRRADVVGRGLPYLVGERAAGVVGYCYAGLYRPRSAYRYTLEDSIYIDEAQTGRGIGRRLLTELLAQSAALGYRQMIAVIGGGHETVPSIRLHEAVGFTHVGVFAGIGFKFGRWIDTALMQCMLGPGRTVPPG